MSDPDLVVVGGGPAGMSAAIAAAEHGVSCCLIDEGFDLGGQIYRPPTAPDRAPTPSPRGAELRQRLAALGDRVELARETAVFGIFDQLTLGLVHGETTRALRPKSVVLATGAYEYVPPFPGWTLPGVMTPGAAQVLAKTMGVAPGRKVLVAGSGPFLLVVACQLLRLGVRVEAVLEASPRRPWWLLPLAGWRTPGLLAEGLAYLAQLRRAGVPVRHGRIAVAAEGDGALHAVTHAPVDAGWVPDRSQSERVEVDTLCVGYGFVPRSSLAQMAGCRLEYRPELGGWIPVRDRDLRTSVASVLAAGDGAGVAGALSASLEGRLAGLAAAADLGALPHPRFAAERERIQHELGRIGHLRRALDRISTPRPGLETLAAGNTLVCRCEEVSCSTAIEAIRHGGTRFRSLKVMTRIGMGPCQGRFCWPALARRVAGETGCSVAEVGPSSPRAPQRPLSLGALAGAGSER